MSHWKEQIWGIYNELSLQEVLHKTLREIDKSILSGKSISAIIEQGYFSMLEITRAVDIEFRIGKAIVNLGEIKSDLDKCEKIEIPVDPYQEDWDTYIDYVDIYIEKDNNLDNVCITPLENKKEAIETIARQLNIAITKSIEKKVSRLHHEITTKFAEMGDAKIVFDLICQRITNIIPDTLAFKRLDKDKLRVQLLLFPDIENQDYLRIVGSTLKQDIGGLVKKNRSTSGSLFYLQNKEELPSGYHVVFHNNQRYVYFLGNPQENEKYYKKTMRGEYKSELAIPIYSEQKTPIGVINLETELIDSFRDTHAKTLIYHATGIAELASSIWRLSSGKLETINSLIYTLETYVSHAMNEFDHQIGHPKQKLSALIREVRSLNLDTTSIEDKIEGIFNEVRDSQNILRNTLESFNITQSNISLESKIEEVKRLIGNKLSSEEIELEIIIDDNVNYVKLDNLFTQYLYSLIDNSVDAVIRKKMILTKAQKKNYEPLIKFTARPQNEYTLDSIDEEAGEVRKCHISIYDNGIGIESEKLSTLGTKGVTYRGGTGSGYGLYAFRQYLSLHNARVVDMQSDYMEYFSIHFVVELGKVDV